MQYTKQSDHKNENPLFVGTDMLSLCTKKCCFWIVICKQTCPPHFLAGGV